MLLLKTVTEYKPMEDEVNDIALKILKLLN